MTRACTIFFTVLIGLAPWSVLPSESRAAPPAYERGAERPRRAKSPTPLTALQQAEALGQLRKLNGNIQSMLDDHTVRRAELERLEAALEPLVARSTRGESKVQTLRNPELRLAVSTGKRLLARGHDRLKIADTIIGKEAAVEAKDAQITRYLEELEGEAIRAIEVFDRPKPQIDRLRSLSKLLGKEHRELALDAEKCVGRIEEAMRPHPPPSSASIDDKREFARQVIERVAKARASGRPAPKLRAGMDDPYATLVFFEVPHAWKLLSSAPLSTAADRKILGELEELKEWAHHAILGPEVDIVVKGDVLLKDADTLAKTGDETKAIAKVEQAVELMDVDDVKSIHRMTPHYHAADIYERLGKHELAIIHLARTLALRDTSWLSFRKRSLDDMAEQVIAAHRGRQSLLRNLDAGQWLNRLGHLYGKIGQRASAKRLLLRAETMMRQCREEALERAEAATKAKPGGGLQNLFIGVDCLEWEADLLAERGQARRAAVLLSSSPQPRMFAFLRLAGLRASLSESTAALDALEHSSRYAQPLLEMVYRIEQEEHIDVILEALAVQEELALAIALGIAPDAADPLRRGAMELALFLGAQRKGRALDVPGISPDHLRTEAQRAAWKTLVGKRGEHATRYFHMLSEAGAAPAGYETGLEASILRLEEEVRMEKPVTQRDRVVVMPHQPEPRGSAGRPTRWFEQIQRALASSRSGLVDIVAINPIDISSLGTSASPVREPLRYYAFIVPPTGEPELVDLGDTESIDGLVHVLYSELRTPLNGDSNAIRRVKDAGAALYSRVWSPVVQTGRLQGIERVRISAEGGLHLIPFDTLVDPATDHWLGEDRVTFSYLESPRDLLDRGPATNPGGAPVVMAAATLPRADRYRFSNSVIKHFERNPLFAAHGEARRVAELLPGALLLEGNGATEAALLELDHPSILHLAVHGLFLDAVSSVGPGSTPSRGVVRVKGAATPMKRRWATHQSEAWLRVALQLSPPTTSDDARDGFATAYELSIADLHETEMVVLSACDTGVGHIVLRDGVASMRRALRLAGARSVVASHWPVADVVTGSLMEHFYERLMAGDSRIDALRSAMSFIRTRHEHPYFWAPFTVTGGIEGLGGMLPAASSPQPGPGGSSLPPAHEARIGGDVPPLSSSGQ